MTRMTRAREKKEEKKETGPFSPIVSFRSDIRRHEGLHVVSETLPRGEQLIEQRHYKRTGRL